MMRNYFDVAFDRPKENEFAVSDDDSDESDGKTTGKVQHLPRRILRSTAELSSKHEKSQEVLDKCYAKKRALAKKKKVRHWQDDVDSFLAPPPEVQEVEELPTESPLTHL